jgi:D-sedoheptulose 7-phosphate isomerase
VNVTKTSTGYLVYVMGAVFHSHVGREMFSGASSKDRKVFITISPVEVVVLGPLMGLDLTRRIFIGGYMYTHLDMVIDIITGCIRRYNKVITFGVGGNAANAIHFAAELQGKFERFENPLPCIDIVSNPSIITAISQDFGWEHCFERQIRALVRPGDVVFGFSISTNGKYLENAIKEAKKCNALVVLSCGMSSGNEFLKDVILLEEYSGETPYVQEKQLALLHRICREVKERLI